MEAEYLRMEKLDEQDEAEYLRMEELEHEQKLERERKDEAEYLEYLEGVWTDILRGTRRSLRDLIRPSPTWGYQRATTGLWVAVAG